MSDTDRTETDSEHRNKKNKHAKMENNLFGDSDEDATDEELFGTTRRRRSPRTRQAKRGRRQPQRRAAIQATLKEESSSEENTTNSGSSESDVVSDTDEDGDFDYATYEKKAAIKKVRSGYSPPAKHLVKRRRAVARDASPQRKSSSSKARGKGRRGARTDNHVVVESVSSVKILGLHTDGSMNWRVKLEGQIVESFPNKVMRQNFPEQVIDFYEKHLRWAKR